MNATDEQLRQEIEALREQAAGCPPSAGYLQSIQYASFLRRAWAIENEIHGHKFVATRGKKREAKRLRHSWVRDLVRNDRRTVAGRANAEADKRLRLVLEVA